MIQLSEPDVLGSQSVEIIENQIRHSFQANSSPQALFSFRISADFHWTFRGLSASVSWAW